MANPGNSERVPCVQGIYKSSLTNSSMLPGFPGKTLPGVKTRFRGAVERLFMDSISQFLFRIIHYLPRQEVVWDQPASKRSKNRVLQRSSRYCNCSLGQRPCLSARYHSHLYVQVTHTFISYKTISVIFYIVQYNVSKVYKLIMFDVRMF